MMLARSASDAFATTSAAVGPSWPIRMSSGPPSRNEKPRSAWSSCIEETPTSITTPSTAAAPCAAQTSARLEKRSSTRVSRPSDSLDQIEAAGNRRPVAVDADDPGSRDLEDRAAVAAGAEGRVDIDAAVARARASRPPRGRARGYGAAQPGSCAGLWRIPACERETWTRTGPLRLKSLRFAGLFRPKSRETGTIAVAAPGPRNPSFPDGICWAAMAFRARKRASAVPKPGSALHHLVTAFSVKKALMVGRGFSRISATLKPVMRPAHTRVKMQAGTRPPRLRGRQRKGIVNGTVA